MVRKPKMPTLRDEMLLEIANELSQLEGQELDSFLSEVGEDSDRLLQQHLDALAAARLAHRKRRLDQARAQLRSRPQPDFVTLHSLGIERKRALLAAIEKRAQETGEMTLAARNRRTNSEADINSFLEACLRLGLIDQEGQLKK